MNKLLLALMLALTSTSAMAAWTAVSNSDNFTTYVDLATISKAGNRVKMWELRNYKNVQKLAGDKYLSQITQVEYDCKKEQSRPLTISQFSEIRGNGRVVFSRGNPSDKWLPAKPGSVAKTLLKIACNKR